MRLHSVTFAQIRSTACDLPATALRACRFSRSSYSLVKEPAPITRTRCAFEHRARNIPSRLARRPCRLGGTATGFKAEALRAQKHRERARTRSGAGFAV